MSLKICKGCKKELSIDDFYFSGNERRKARCKNCINGNWTYRIMSTISSRTKRTPRDGYDRKSIMTDHQINTKFLHNLKNKQNGLCYWTNIPIDFSLSDKLRKPSLDRLDNRKGYTTDNVVLTTLFANLGRRDATIVEYKFFLNTYVNTK
jgi:hypothetical protein